MAITWALHYLLLNLPALAINWALEAAVELLPAAWQRQASVAILMATGWLLGDLVGRLLRLKDQGT